MRPSCRHKHPGQGQCQRLIPVMNDYCGHTTVIKCFMLDAVTGIIDLKFKLPPCRQICSSFLPCGHYCAKQCHSKMEHHDCQDTRQCQKVSQCGHQCLQTHPCGISCPPCTTIITYRPKRMVCPHLHLHYGPCWQALQDPMDKEIRCTLPCAKYTCGVDHQCLAPCDYHHDKKGGNLQCPNNCVKTCNKKLTCGHSCPFSCDKHPMGPDGRRVCPPCKDRVTTVMCPRQLHQVTVPCNKMTEVPTCKDERLVDVKAKCGHLIHTYKVICSEIDENIKKKAHKHCTEICAVMLACGHSCPGRCVKCYSSSYHERCSEPCFNVLICNHPCQTPCSKMCGHCKRPCERKCEHGSCPRKCCLPCIECNEPCTYICPHLRCSKKCHEICDRPPCQEPCMKTLPCGHFCIGFCGEPCPPLCRICNGDTLLAEMLLGETEIEDNDRFIFLPDCGHTISYNFMDGFMNSTTVPKSLSYEINPKRCPLCQRSIYNCRRYFAIVNQYKDDIDKAKKSIFGDYNQISNTISGNKAQLSGSKSLYFQRFRNIIYFQLWIESKQNFKPMSLEVVKSLEHLTSMYSKLTLYVDELKSKHVPKVYIDSFASADHDFTINFGTRMLPLTAQEFEETEQQLTRFRDLRKLYLFHSELQSQATLRLILAQKDDSPFSAANKILSGAKRYSTKSQSKVLRHFKAISESLRCKLNISDVERKEIVEAFGRGRGRFFRCQKGHIYVITECGGPMMESVCPECKAIIGGSQHLAHEGNQLATEMDGAVTPLWPNSLQ